jgi:hypothetical protein
VTTWPLVLASAALNRTEHYVESTHTASWLLVVVVAAVPPTVLGLRVAAGMRRGGMDPDRPRPLLEGMPAGAANTQVDGAGGVNGVSDVPTPGTDDPTNEWGRSDRLPPNGPEAKPAIPSRKRTEQIGVEPAGYR